MFCQKLFRAVAASVTSRPSDLLKASGPHENCIHESFTRASGTRGWPNLKVKRRPDLNWAAVPTPKLRRAISRELHYDQKLR